MASNFPKLPGHVPTQDIDSNWFRRVSHVQQEKNKDVKNVQPTRYPLPRQQQPQIPDQTRMFNPNYLSTTHDSFKPKDLNGELQDATTRFQPDYVYMDRQTLRFYGYFQESVCESNLESYRVRNVIIYYYLDDNTISMIEPKQMNSGINQGIFLKRQKVLRGDNSGKFFGVEDFRVGEDVIIFGKNIRINAVDEYTREFFENIGQPQEQDQQVGIQDNWSTKTLIKPKPVKDKAMTDYMEHKLGGGKPNPAKQFLENDRKVLKFYVYSDSPYILHYFLADDTIEIREINFQNSGKDPFPLLLRRQKLPRKFALNQPGQTYAEDYVKPQDIQQGSYVSAFGRNFLVQGCDPYTNRYYHEKYNIEFPVGSVQEPQPKQLPSRQIPPYNGFGDEEDSLGYVYRLEPKAPRKDFFKWVDNQVNLRFWAKFNTKKPEDVNRRFIITYFLNDDSLMVYEPDQRNSGQVSGKFLERKKYKNIQKNNQIFQPTDFIVGRDILINGTSFHLEDADEFTKKWFSQYVQVK
ncbi:hypothetical protein PPERSA_13139 [Pseudocohnilembus persalinus]|uniref:DM10 domain-containing protein n=1 Tax=Pseudocohnilembus persalinus TaxID=266149 RepID=A0A0V0QWT8_PSEPJ|nr:hypothetical protein PPERSA_13139 [Pseudocohnilembus persalinus]|eukprot:KRX06660.1 hypothetical protein PPERSA_13139 [Pseudocohnilembus persalinus]